MTTQEKRQWKDLADDEEENDDSHHLTSHAQPHFTNSHPAHQEGETKPKEEKPVTAEGETKPQQAPKKPFNSKKIHQREPPAKRKHKIEYLETKKAGIKASKNVYDLESSSDEDEEAVEGETKEGENAPKLPEQKQQTSEESPKEEEPKAKEEVESAPKHEEKKVAVVALSKKQQKQQQLNELEQALKEAGLETTAVTVEEEKKKSKKEKKPKAEKKEDKPAATEATTTTTTATTEEVKKQDTPVVDPVIAAKEALLKRAQLAAQKSNANAGKTSQEVAKQEILQRQNKVKRAQGKKKEDL